MIRSAKSSGLNPFNSGVSCVEEVSIDLLRAVQHAERIISWQENLIEEEMPPVWMWPFEDRLSVWFEQVKAKRESGVSNSDSSDDSSMLTNEFAERFR